MTLARWNDDRLDDMRALVDAIDKRQDVQERQIATNTSLGESHERELSKLDRSGLRKNERIFTLLLMVPTWVIALVTIIIEVTHIHHG